MADNAKKAKQAAHSRWKKINKKTDKTENISWEDLNLTLVFHTPQFSPAELLVKPELFPGISQSGLLEVVPHDTSLRPFIVQLSEKSLSSKPNFSMSISSQLASSLGIYNLRSLDVNIKVPNSGAYELDFALIAIKDNLLSRADMWQLSTDWQGRAVHRGQRISSKGFRVEVSSLLKDNKPVLTGVITNKTVVNFKSKSASLVWLIEISKDMYEYTPEGLLYIEKTYRFLRTAFERQLIRGTTHEITIVFFMRLLYEPSQYNHRDRHLDVYRQVLRITDLKNSWKDALKLIKWEFNHLPVLINWKVDCPSSVVHFMRIFSNEPVPAVSSSLLYQSYFDNEEYPECSLAPSHQTNFLEAINYCLSQILETRASPNLTGNALMIISAGTAVYHTQQDLAEVTKVRLLTSGTYITLISLKRKSLQPVPMLIFDSQSQYMSQASHNTLLDLTDEDWSCNTPYWLNTSWFYANPHFEGSCNMQSAHHSITLDRPRRFTPFFQVEKKNEELQVPDLPNPIIRELFFVNQASPTTSMLIGIPDHMEAIQVPRHRLNTVGHKSKGKDSTDMLEKELMVFPSRRNSADHIEGTIRCIDSSRNLDSSRNIDCTPRYLDGLRSFDGIRRRVSSLKRRWGLSFPKNVSAPEEMYSDDSLLYSIEVIEYYEKLWNTLIEPPLLPIYNDFWPKCENRGINNHRLSVLPESVRGTEIIKLIKNRLNKGFQLAYDSANDNALKRSPVPVHNLSLGKSYHTISPSPSDDFNIDFNIYSPNSPALNYPTKCCHYDLETQRREVKVIDFFFNYDINWDIIDQEILGYDSS